MLHNLCIINFYLLIYKVLKKTFLIQFLTHTLSSVLSKEHSSKNFVFLYEKYLTDKNSKFTTIVTIKRELYQIK